MDLFPRFTINERSDPALVLQVQVGRLSQTSKCRVEKRRGDLGRTYRFSARPTVDSETRIPISFKSVCRDVPPKLVSKSDTHTNHATLPPIKLLAPCVASNELFFHVRVLLHSRAQKTAFHSGKTAFSVAAHVKVLLHHSYILSHFASSF